MSTPPSAAFSIFYPFSKNRYFPISKPVSSLNDSNAGIKLVNMEFSPDPALQMQWVVDHRPFITLEDWKLAGSSAETEIFKGVAVFKPLQSKKISAVRQWDALQKKFICFADIHLQLFGAEVG
jgi:hypothetical protein